MYAYSNNGFSFRAIDPGMEEPGEVVFDGIATDDELRAAFPGRDDIKKAQAIAERAQDIQDRIDALEAKQGRAVRDALLTGDKTRLEDIESRIAVLRAKLA